MAGNYDIMKENNLYQMVSEYEKEQKSLHEKRAQNMQRRHDYMKTVALQKLEDIREEEELDYGKVVKHFTSIRCAFYAPHFQDLITGYTDHVYDNARAILKRKYAEIYDKDNLNKYPKATPLPRMQDIMDPYMPIWMTYEKLKGLAAHCHKWRQK